MRILLLAPCVPDLSDPRLDTRTIEVLRFLAREHEVTLLAFFAEQVDPLIVQALDSLCAAVQLVPAPDSFRRRLKALKGNATVDPTYPLGHKADSPMHTAVVEALRLRRIEVIHLADVGMMQFVPPAWEGPIVLDARSERWKHLVRHVEREGRQKQRELRQLRVYETAAYRRANVTLATDEAARAELEGLVGASWAVHVVPPSVDVALWEPLWRAPRPRAGHLLTVSQRGGIDEQAALAWLMHYVDTQLRLQLPLFRHDIVGGPFRTDLRLETLEHPEVALIEDLRSPAPSWDSATVYLAPPLRDGLAHPGMLEALAAGVPLVASSLACDGLPLEHNRHVLVADTLEEMAAAVVRLYQEPVLARHLAAEGHRLVRDRYDVGIASAAISAAYDHVAVGEFRCALCS
jgi:glycosyltransferase involved in cell wall biosynthesis